MLPSVFAKVLHEHRRATVGWSLGVAGFIVVELAAFPSVRSASGIQDVWQQMPDAMKAMFGLDSSVDFFSGAGFLEAELFGFTLPLVFAILAISIGSKVVAGEEDVGLLELELAHPVSRSRYLFESFAATVVIVCTPAIVALVVLVLGNPVVGIDVPVVNLVGALARLAAFGVLFAAAATAVGAALGRRGPTVAITATLSLALFLLSTLGRIVPRIEPLGDVSPFEWLLGGHPIATGFTGGVITALVAAAVVMGAGAAMFNHRDLR